jgi:hypothetical protein
MAILPREQLVQRRDATVAAPGVVLWSSTTNLTTCEVQNTNLVVEGEPELAQTAPPEWFFDVVIGTAYPEDEAADVQDGVYQDHTYDGMDFGEGPFGGVELEWNVEHPTYGWGIGAGENGVYP